MKRSKKSHRVPKSQSALMGLYRDELKPTKKWVSVESVRTVRFSISDLNAIEITREEILSRTNGDFKNLIIS